MSGHYLGTAEIRKPADDALLAIIHRYKLQDGSHREYWMTRDVFHLWDDGAVLQHRFVALGANPAHDDLATFRQFAVDRFAAEGVQKSQLKLWNHDPIRPEPIP